MGGAAAGAAAAPAAGAGMTFGGGGAGAPPGVIGDMLPISIMSIPGKGGGEVPGGGPPAGPPALKNVLQLRTLKIGENQSPRPIDRIFGTFNFYDNINRSYTNRLTNQVQHVRAYRQLYGFEKTFLGGQASFGIVDTINSLDVNAHNPMLNPGMHTAQGTLNTFFKYVLLANPTYSRLLTAGLDLGYPTGPRGLGGYQNIAGFRNTQIQPFLGYLWSQNRWFVQGFSSINVATDKHDVTLIFNDIALGYYLYAAQNPRALISAIVPVFETHVNTPLNHRGFSYSDPASTPDNVNFTFGTTFVLQRRTYATFAYVTPVTGPKPFDYEIVAQLNFRFGGYRGGGPAPIGGPSSPVIPASSPVSTLSAPPANPY
jgi:hypothetical protein